MSGRAWRPTAAASGRAASIETLVSGLWALGNSGYTIPGLSLIAPPASRFGQVIQGLAGRPEKGLVQDCSREGEEKPGPELFTLVGVVFKSCLRSGRASLYSLGNSQRSSPKVNAEFLLVAGMGGCVG